MVKRAIPCVIGALLALVVLPPALSSARPSGSAAARSCAVTVVRTYSGDPLTIRPVIRRGRVRCRAARWAFRYAYAHPDLKHGNKYLGNPPGWYCVVGRAVEEGVAGRCARKRNGARVIAYVIGGA